MHELHDDPELQPAMQKAAEFHAFQYAKHFDLHLDYSEHSLNAIDHAITTYHPDGLMNEDMYHTYIAYIGEVARRNLGGRWMGTDQHGPVVHVEHGENQAIAYLYAWVRKRFEDGVEEPIASKYSATKSIVGLPSELSTAAPAAEPLLADPASFDVSDTTDLIGRAPVTIFLMVAASDGTIDKKEALAFQKIVTDSVNHKSPLFQASIAAMLPKFHEHLEASSGSPIKVMTDLMEMRSEVESMFPDQAKEFFTALVELGEKVAKASGGFLGFGKKIGKGEAAALELIKVSLGLLS